jgi:enolase
MFIPERNPALMSIDVESGHAVDILDSRGRSTLAATLWTNGVICGVGPAPSGSVHGSSARGMLADLATLDKLRG